MSNIPEELPKVVVDEIIRFINENSAFLEAGSAMPLGKHIFDIIEKKCLVVYYPIEDAQEENDGFLFQNVPLKNGDTINIVFINTYQTQEKQVFAAAHELGHYMKVAQTVNSKCGTSISEELIVNRFAAELLMPQPDFMAYFSNLLRKKSGNLTDVSIKIVLDVIVETMNHFSVPYNAVVIRLVEVGYIKRKTGCALADGNESISLESIKRYIDKVISNGQFENLRISSMKKEIKDLETILNKAEKEHGVSDVKIRRLRDAFGIVPNMDTLLKENINISEG